MPLSRSFRNKRNPLFVVVLFVLCVSGLGVAHAQGEVTKGLPSACGGAADCIGMVIDSGDPVLVKMGEEMSNLVSDNRKGTVVRPTEGPIANVRNMLSKTNAGLSVVPSDMLRYTDRSGEARLRRASKRLRFIMGIGKKTVYLVANKSIESVKDLQGKRVVMGPSNTAIWVVSNNLLALHGVKPKKRIQQKPPAGLLTVMTGKADAVFVVGPNPHPLMNNLVSMTESEKYGKFAKELHLLPITVPDDATEYKREKVSYPGFTEETDTVAIIPTLVSYDFTHKDIPYFKRRCNELARIGKTVVARLDELRATGHKQWQDTSWSIEAGAWKKDSCFFRDSQ